MEQMASVKQSSTFLGFFCGVFFARVGVRRLLLCEVVPRSLLRRSSLTTHVRSSVQEGSWLWPVFLKDDMNQPRALARPRCWDFCFQPMSIMSLLSLQKLLLMLLLQFTADQRKEFFTLLSFCWSKTIRITDGFPARCSLAGRQFGVYKRFNENLALYQLLANTLGLSTHTRANQDPKKMSNDLFSPNEEVKSFTWETKPKWANQ